MSNTTVKLEGLLANPEAMFRELSAVPYKQAKQFQESQRLKMVNQAPKGNLYEKRSGKFQRFHRASARGQRPQPDTQTLANALKAERTGEFSATVDLISKINPENGADAKKYGQRLVEKMGRVIVDRLDVVTANTSQAYEVQKILDKYL